MSLIKKVSIILLCISLFSFCIPGIVQADSGDTVKAVGGKLLEPIENLLITIGDVVYDLIHKYIIGQDESLLHLDLTATWKDVVKWVAVVIGAILVIVAIAALLAVGQGWIATAAGAISKALVAKGGLLAAAGAKIAIGKLSATTIIMASLTGGGLAGVKIYNSMPNNDLFLPVYTISPEEIFSNKIALFDVDFFNPTGEKREELVEDENGGTKTVTKYIDKYVINVDDEGNEQTIEIESTAGALQATISTWYSRLRDISIVALLSILVYIGIKILLSSISTDKAKYKQMLVDWIIALCLLFVMQYIMSFANIVVDKVTEMVSSSVQQNGYLPAIKYDKKIKTRLKDQYNYDFDEEKNVKEFEETDENGKTTKIKYMFWKTNLLGVVRLNAQNAKGQAATYFGYTIIFLVLVFYTAFFTFTYLKRVLYMAFLTIVAPLVALTYPIDKINDGKAQAFNMWLKEYIFNLLIQPVHLLLYMILITSVFELASKNILYSLVAIGFMMPAEKLMRKFFGFEKAQTPGLLAGPAGAAMMMAGMNKLLHKGSKGGKDGSGKGDGASDKKDNDNIKFNDKLDTDAAIAGDTAGGENNETSDNAITGNDENNKYLNRGDAPNSPDAGAPQYTEDKLFDIGKNWGDRSIEKAKNWWETSPEAVYAKDTAHRIANSSLGNVSKSAAKRIGGAVRAGAGKVYNSRPIKGIRNSRTWQAGKYAGKFYAKGMANKISKKFKNGNWGRKAIRMVGGAALGATAAGIGLTAGIASGDPSKAFQYTTGAALGGYTLGSGTVNKAADVLSVEGTKEAFEKNFYGEEEYNERQIQNNIKTAKKDWETQQYFERKFGSSDKAKELMNSETFEKCIRNGLKDPKEIYAIHKMKEENNINDEKAIAVALTAKDYVKDKNTNRLGAKEDEELNKTLLNRAKNNKYIHTDEEAEKIGKETRKLMNSWSKFKFEE